MLFFNAIMLAGLGALVIPLILHFFLKGRVKRMRFSSVLFLMEDTQQKGFLRRLRNLFLLLIRMALIAILVLAFARPYQEAVSSSEDERPGYAAFVLDTSASMRAGLETGHWESVVNHIVSEAASLKPGDKAALLTCAAGNPVQVSWDAPSKLIEAARTLKPGFQSSPLIHPLEAALDLFQHVKPNRAKAVLYVVSDFQDVSLNRISKASIPKEIELHLIPMPQSINGNVQIGIQSLDPTGKGICVAEIKNMDGGIKKQLRTEFRLDGKRAGEQRVDLNPYQRQWIEFSIPELGAGDHRIEVELFSDEGFAFDNVFYGCFRIDGKTEVICVNEENSNGTEHPLFFLENAWDPTRSSALRLGSPFSFKRLAPSLAIGRLYEPLDSTRHSIVVVPGLMRIPEELGNALRRHVARGGGILFFAGEHGWPLDYNTAFKDLLPARFGRVVEAGKSGQSPARILKLDRNHPALAPFHDAKSGDLSSILFHSWRELVPSEDTEMLASFDNGTPVILHRRVGEGHVLLVNHSCDAAWSDWPKKRTFLPMIHGLGKFLAGQDGAKPVPFYFAGSPITTHAAEPIEGIQLTMTTPSGEQIMGKTDLSGNAVWLLEEAGFSELKTENGESERLAVNAAREESSASFLTTDMVEKLIQRGNFSVPRHASVLGLRLDNKEFYQWLMAVGLVLLLAELFISNRFAN